MSRHVNLCTLARHYVTQNLNELFLPRDARSAKRGIAVVRVVRPSVRTSTCLSVTLTHRAWTYDGLVLN